jgi:acylpyruvate hydrolase
MRFVTFHLNGESRQRFGARLGDSFVVDLEAATQARLADEGAGLAHKLPPPDALGFIAAGEGALQAALDALRFVQAKRATGGDTQSIWPLDRIVLDAPLPNPGKIIAAGKNFVEHMAEMTSVANPVRPVAFAQMNSTLIGAGATIPIPPETEKLDYEVEVAVIIGKPAFMVAPADALDHVFGYTIFNDLSARDLYRSEQAVGIPLLGKNLAGFAPMGPHIVTRDEIPDPSSLALRTRVNGELRQNSTLKSMLFGIPELISWWSRIGLEPGDILTTGTPSGVAAGRKPGETPWWIRPGDVVEVEVDSIGTLRTFFAN